MASHLTIRGVSAALDRRLKDLAKTRGESVNTTVLALLEQAAGVSARRERLLRYATWTREDLSEMEEERKAQRQVDAKMWKRK
jgi:hypothetical protein